MNFYTLFSQTSPFQVVTQKERDSRTLQWKFTRPYGNCAFLFIYPNMVPFNPLTPELNPSAERCLTRILLGILLLEP
jgi:hypothetical protein